MVRTADALLQVGEQLLAQEWSSPASTVAMVLGAAHLTALPLDASRGVCRTTKGLTGRYRQEGNRLVAVDFRFEDDREIRMEELGDVIADWFDSRFGARVDSATRHHSEVRAHRWVHRSGLVSTLEVTPAPEPLVICQVAESQEAANRLAGERQLIRAGRLLPTCWPDVSAALPRVGLRKTGTELSAPTAPTVTGHWPAAGEELYLRYRDPSAEHLDELVEQLVRAFTHAHGAPTSDETDDDQAREITWGTSPTLGVVRSLSLGLLALYLAN